MTLACPPGGSDRAFHPADRDVYSRACGKLVTLLLENLALRQQLSVLKRRHPRARLNLSDRLFWLLARRCWSGWKQALLVVTTETVVGWRYVAARMAPRWLPVTALK